MLDDADNYLRDCMTFCNTAKYVAEHWDWEDKPSRSGYLVATSPLMDSDWSTIVGVRLYGQYHVGEDTGFEYLHLGINLAGGLRARICGLDVHPAHERGHFDKVNRNVYGPHFHWGDCKKLDVSQHRIVNLHPDFDVGNLERWIKIFKEKARVIANNNYDVTVPPMERDLFGPIL